MTEALSRSYDLRYLEVRTYQLIPPYFDFNLVPGRVVAARDTFTDVANGTSLPRRTYLGKYLHSMHMHLHACTYKDQRRPRGTIQGMMST